MLPSDLLAGMGRAEEGQFHKPALSFPTWHLLVTKVCVAFSSPFRRRASMLDFYFDHSEERPLEAFEDIFASYENKK